MAQPNWVKIRARYERGGISYRDLAEAEGVPFPTLRDRAKREGWQASAKTVRAQIVTRTSQKVIESASAEAADYVTQHTDDWQTLRAAIMGLLEADFSKLTEEQVDELKAKASFAIAASKAYKEVQQGQRLSLGLDKPEQPKPPEDGAANGVVMLPQKVPVPEKPQ